MKLQKVNYKSLMGWKRVPYFWHRLIPLVEDYLPADQKVVRFGPGAELEITELIERKDSLTFKANFLEKSLDLPVTGKYNATNAMIASYVALQEGVTEEQIGQAFQDLELTAIVPSGKKHPTVQTSYQMFTMLIQQP